MSGFAIAVLCILIVVTLFYLIIALYSFGVKLPKWLRITTGVFFIIVYSVLAILGFAMMKNVSMLSASMVLVIVNLILGIYMLLATKAPKRLKILVGIVACILVVIHIISCFAVPAMYGSVTMNMGLNGL